MTNSLRIESDVPAGFMVQQAPYPGTLDYLVSQLRYKPGWTFTLADMDRGQGSKGLTLCIRVSGLDTNDPRKQTSVRHYMPVPPAAYNRESWVRWLFEQILAVDLHEAMEFFRIEERQVYPPNHGPGWDPYQLRELNTREAAETTFKGEPKAMREPLPADAVTLLDHYRREANEFAQTVDQFGHTEHAEKLRADMRNIEALFARTGHKLAPAE